MVDSSDWVSKDSVNTRKWSLQLDLEEFGRLIGFRTRG